MIRSRVALDAPEDAPKAPVHRRQSGVLRQHLPYPTRIERQPAFNRHAGPAIETISAAIESAFERVDVFNFYRFIEREQLGHHVVGIVVPELRSSDDALHMLRRIVEVPRLIIDGT